MTDADAPARRLIELCRSDNPDASEVLRLIKAVQGTLVNVPIRLTFAAGFGLTADEKLEHEAMCRDSSQYDFPDCVARNWAEVRVGTGSTEVWGRRVILVTCSEWFSDAVGEFMTEYSAAVTLRDAQLPAELLTAIADAMQAWLDERRDVKVWGKGELAKHVGVDARTLKRDIDKGRLVVIETSYRHWTISDDDLQRYIRSCRS